MDTRLAPEHQPLYDEIAAYPVPPDTSGDPPTLADNVAMQLRLRSEHGVLSFISTTTVFGTAVEVRSPPRLCENCDAVL